MEEDARRQNELALEEWRAKLAECTVKAECGRSFVRVDSLSSWMTGRPSTQSVPPVERLLRAAYHHHRQPLPIYHQILTSDEHRCLLVFSILLELNAGDLIDKVQRKGIVDKALPRSLLRLAGIMKQILDEDSDSDRPNLANEFDKLQWKYCSPKLEYMMGRDFIQNRIMPFISKQKIKRGGTAQLYRIEVPREFVHSRLRPHISQPRHQSPKSGAGNYFVALKTFTEGDRRWFDNEKRAFHALRENERMVRFLGEFEHQEGVRNVDGEETVQTTFNILLEYGELDLWGCFIWRKPPVLKAEIEKFYEILFEVADALRGVHNFRDTGYEFHGWHADVKPDNILLIDGKFKLADPGCASFKEAGRGPDPPKGSIFGHTRTYGAPELSNLEMANAPNEVEQTIDIWSFGCVLSVTATWVVHGKEGVLEYNRVRKRAIDEFIQRSVKAKAKTQYPHKLHEVTHRTLPSHKSHHGQTRGDFFHDGEKVLPEVTEWHHYLRLSLRKTDNVTSALLDLVDSKMLLSKPQDRISAKELYAELKQIMPDSKTEEDASPIIAESLMELLHSVQAEPPSESSSSTPLRHMVPSEPDDRSVFSLRQAQKTILHDMPVLKSVQHDRIIQPAMPKLIETPLIINTEYSLQHTPNTREQPSLEAVTSSPSDTRLDSLNLPPDPIQLHEHLERSRIPFEASGHVQATSPTPSTRPSRSNSHRRPRIKPSDVKVPTRRRSRIFSLILRRPKDAYLDRFFNNRHIHLLIDNSATMALFWEQATALVEKIVKVAEGLDRDGIDLTFFSGRSGVIGGKTPSKFRDAMSELDKKPVPDVSFDIRYVLGEIFESYVTLPEARASIFYPPARYPERKTLTLLILTDGVWDAVRDKDGVRQKIIHLVKTHKEKFGDIRERPFSIEFIQFGTDPDATVRLKRLDNNLEWEGIPDIIDTEPADGNIYKMLLGSFLEDWDFEDEALEDSSGLLSPEGGDTPTHGTGPPEAYSAVQSPTQLHTGDRNFTT